MKLFPTLLLACCLLKQADTLKCLHCENEECDSKVYLPLDCPKETGYACFSGSVKEINTKSCFGEEHCGEKGAQFVKNVTVEDDAVVLVEGVCCEDDLCNGKAIENVGVALKLKGGEILLKYSFFFTAFLVFNFYV